MATSLFRLRAQTRGVVGTCIVRAEFSTDEIGTKFFDHMREFGFVAEPIDVAASDDLASQLCHALDSGLTSDPETAERVAAWLLARFDLVAK